MTRNDALIIAAILAVGVSTMLVRGEAAAGKGIRRETEPFAYWLVVAAASVGFVAMLIVAWLR